MYKLSIVISMLDQWIAFDTKENKMLYNACEYTEESFESVMSPCIPEVGETIDVENWIDDGYRFECIVTGIKKSLQVGSTYGPEIVFKVFVDPVVIFNSNNVEIYRSARSTHKARKE